MAWREDLQPASFRGVPFFMETTTREGGRRNVPHEFPKRNTGLTEDMGRRLKAFGLRGYLVGEDHHAQADALISALESDGPGTLVTPLRGSMSVIVDTFAAVDKSTEMRITYVDMQFIEAGSGSSPVSAIAGIGAVLAAAGAAVSAVQSNLQSRFEV